MARELILVPKVKYEELLSKNEKTTDEIRKDDNNGDNKENNGDNKENNGKEIKKDDNKDGDSTIKSSTKMLNDQPKNSFRRSMRKKSQQGGQLYIKKAPVNFMRTVSRKETKRKWLSFKL